MPIIRVPQDVATLAEALAAVNPGDTIQVQPNYGLWHQTHTVFDNNLTIEVAATVFGLKFQLAEGVTSLTIAGDAEVIVYGSTGDDTITGNSGRNWLRGGLGADALNGGGGIDYADYATATAAVHVYLDAAIFNTGEAAGDTYISIEGVIGTQFDDVLVGGVGDDILGGGFGQDVLMGGGHTLGGYNQLDGGYGVDTVSYGGVSGNLYVDLSPGFSSKGVGYIDVGDGEGFIFSDFLTEIENVVGGSGNDAIYGNVLNNVLNGGAGDDALYGEEGGDFLIGGGHTLGGFNQLYGGSGNDTAVYSQTGGRVYADLRLKVGYVDTGSGFVFSDLLDSIENLTGDSGDDLLLGNDAGNALSGGGGDDHLYGFGGNDTLSGGGHTLGGYDVMFGDAGTDIATFAGVTGNVYADLRAGGSLGVSYVDTGAGYVHDTLMFDVEGLTGGAGNDILFGNGSDNALDGGQGNDLLFGEDGNDTVRTGAGDDLVYGGAGNDTIYLEAGTDSAYGGAGADIFRASSNDVADVVSDFSHDEGDRIQIDTQFYFGGAPNLTFQTGVSFFIGVGAAPTQQRPSVYFDTTTNLLWYDGDGTGGVYNPQAVMFISNGGGGLRAADIIMV